MHREQLIQTLRDIIDQAAVEPIDTDNLTEDTTIGELGFDSLSVLDLVYDVQQAFGLDFEIQELVAVNTVGELIDFLEEEMKG
ncbi:MAG: acyl carrier protein [Kiritimatiellia bacterium]